MRLAQQQTEVEQVLALSWMADLGFVIKQLSFALVVDLALGLQQVFWPSIRKKVPKNCTDG